MDHQIAVVATCMIVFGGVSIAEPGDVSWRLVRPSNTGIAGDFTQIIFVDDDDSPWIGGYVTFWEEGGISHFDGTNWRVLGNVDCNQIASPRFNDVVKTDDGIMWIGSDQGLLRFDPSIDPWCVTRFHPGNSGIPSPSVNNISIAPDGTLWLACDTVGGSSAGGLAQYDPATDTWNSWDTSNGLPWWAGWDWVDYVAVQPDSEGGYTAWFGSNEMGLTTYKDGLFIWYGGPTPPPGNPLPQWVYGKNSVDDQGNLLLGTDQGMALRAIDGTYTMIPAPPSGGATDLMPSGRIAVSSSQAFQVWDGSWTSFAPWGGSAPHTYTIAEDSTGAFWVGGIGGSAKLSDGSWQRHRLTNSGMLDFFIDTIALAPNGDVAMNANAGPGVGGFDVLHPDGTWTNANVLTYGLGLDWPYPTDNTDAVAYRASGELLFAPTNNGVKEYDGTGFRELIPNSWPIRHIGVSNENRAWAATGNGSLFRENDAGEMPVNERFTNSNSPLPAGGIAGIVADPQDPEFIWVGAQFGLAKTDGTSWTVIPREAIGLNLDTLGYHITAFDVAVDGTLWISSGIGLFHYDPTTGLYDTYDLSNSPLPSDDIFNVEIAPDGSVWISMFDHIFPYPGGVAQLKDGVWRVWQQPTSPLPHNQVNVLTSRPVDGGYEVWVGTASEAIAVISVEGEASCPADFNGDGELNFFDVQEFLSAFSAHDQAADLTGEGVFDFFDVSAFLQAFSDGCP
jgi:ligand-binding sensor domain-containing protein